MWATPQRGIVRPPVPVRVPARASRVPVRPRVPRRLPPAAESAELLSPLLLLLLAPGPPARLEFGGPLPEPPQDVLGTPQLLLVLQPVLLQEFVLRLDAFGLPRMGRPLELRSGELRIAQRLTPSSPPPASSLPSFLLSWGRLLPPSSPSRPRGRPSSSPRPSGPCGRSTACVARGPSDPSHGARPCTTGSSSSD